MNEHSGTGRVYLGVGLCAFGARAALSASFRRYVIGTGAARYI
ncbi:hypothetical protein PQQ51_01830 [Paraburkholderia xenovorans]